MTENVKFWIKYKNNQAFPVRYCLFYKNDLKWMQTLFTVSDLISAFFGTDRIAQYSLHLPDCCDKNDFPADFFFNYIDDSNLALDNTLRLSVLAAELYSKRIKKPLLIKLNFNGLNLY